MVAFCRRHTNSTTLYPFRSTDYSNLEIDPWTFQSESGTLLGKQGWPARSILPMNFQPDSLHLLRHFSIQWQSFTFLTTPFQGLQIWNYWSIWVSLTISWDQEFLSRCDMKHWIRLAINEGSLYCNNVSVPILAQPLVPKNATKLLLFSIFLRSFSFCGVLIPLLFWRCWASLCQRASLAWIVYSISIIVDVQR